MKYASKAPPRGPGGKTGSRIGGDEAKASKKPSGGGGIGGGFGGPSDRNGPVGPTNAKMTAVDTKPRLLDDRLLRARDNSGGLVLPLAYARHTLFRDPAQGGVGSPRNDLANQTARRDGVARDTQFQDAAKQRAQTVAQPGPSGQGGKVGIDAPTKVKRGNLFPGQPSD